MPIGPSHSGRGGGGSRSGGFGGGSGRSSSGGGFRIGGFSSHRSSSSHDYHHDPYYHRPPRGPRHMRFFGRTIVVSNGFTTLFIFALIFLIGLCSICFSSIKNASSYGKEIKIYKSDATYFDELIDKAQAGESGYYLTNAYFGSTVYNYYSDNPDDPGIYNAFVMDGVVYYFLVYEYTSAIDGQEYVGMTYTQYSKNQATGMNGTVQIAYTEDDGVMWSINTSYSLENNLDYQYAKSLRKNYITTSLITGGIALVIIAIFTLVLVNKFKKAKQEQVVQEAKDKAEIAEAEAKAEEAQRVAKQKGRVCEYCGSDVPDGAETCPGCGSRDFE